MIKAGDTAENPIAGVRVKILKTQLETNGNGFQVEYFYRPHSGQDLPAHYHLWWDETFEVLAGTCTYMLDGTEHHAKAGDKFTLPARKSHIHPWNTGDQELHIIQTDTFEHASPEAVIDTLNTVASQYGLARDGKVGKDGRPNPLQLAVMLQTLNKHGGYLASSSPAVQGVLVGVLGSIGQLMGYKASYPQYTGD